MIDNNTSKTKKKKLYVINAVMKAISEYYLKLLYNNVKVNL